MIKTHISTPPCENLFLLHANKNGADQSAHERRLFSTINVRYLKSMMSVFDASEFSRLKLVSVAEQGGLKFV